MRERWPSLRAHTATAFPARSTATCGEKALFPASEMVRGVPNAPPGAATAACTRLLEPSERCHTTAAWPSLPIATAGSLASWPATERVDEEVHAAGETAGPGASTSRVTKPTQAAPRTPPRM
jgi:hypothetical protein